MPKGNHFVGGKFPTRTGHLQVHDQIWAGRDSESKGKGTLERRHSVVETPEFGTHYAQIEMLEVPADYEQTAEHGRRDRLSDGETAWRDSISTELRNSKRGWGTEVAPQI